MPYCFEAEGFWARHPQSEGDSAARGLSFSLAAGSLTCLAGVNGCGKSTLLAALAGLYPCGGNTFRLWGTDMNSAAPAQRQALFRRGALLLQEADLQILGGTAEEDIFLALPEITPAVREEGLALARRFGLEHALHASPFSLSYGQKRKLCLCAALIGKPDLLLLDEPFSGLDYPGILELCGVLRRLKEEGATLLVSTHDLAPLAPFADAGLFLKEGEFLFGELGELMPHAERFGVRPF